MAIRVGPLGSVTPLCQFLLPPPRVSSVPIRVIRFIRVPSVILAARKSPTNTTSQKKSLWHSCECQRLCSGDGGNRTRVRRISPVDFYMLSSLVESRRLGPNEQSPLAASLVMSRPLQPGTAADQPPIPSSYPTMVALVSRTWLRLIRQPWHMHNHLHLLFCPAILRGARQPRHAVYDTLSSVETMSSPTSTYTYAGTRTPVPEKHRDKI